MLVSEILTDIVNSEGGQDILMKNPCKAGSQEGRRDEISVQESSNLRLCKKGTWKFDNWKMTPGFEPDSMS